MDTIKTRLRLPSPAMAVAIVALVVGMAGGAYAAKKIGASGLAKNAVKTKKIADKAVTTAKVADSAVTTPKLDATERSEAFHVNVSDPTPLSTTAGPFVDGDRVASLAVPPTTAGNGRFVVTSQVDLGSDGAAGSVTCALRDDGTVVSRGSATLDAAATFQDTISLTGIVDGGAIDVACQSDTPGKARSRVLIANRVASATTP